MVFFLVRIAAFIALLYIIYFFYKLLREPAEKKVTKKAAAACPSPKVFIDYTEGKIKGAKKKAISDHIAHCKNCQNALKDAFDMPNTVKPAKRGRFWR
jgi:hypothetical protein